METSSWLALIKNEPLSQPGRNWENTVLRDYNVNFLLKWGQRNLSKSSAASSSLSANTPIWVRLLALVAVVWAVKEMLLIMVYTPSVSRRRFLTFSLTSDGGFLVQFGSTLSIPPLDLIVLIAFSCKTVTTL